MKAIELKTIMEFMLASANLRPGCLRREAGVYVELARGGMTFTAIQDGIITKVRTRPKDIKGDAFLMFMPIDDVKNILPSLAYEVRTNQGLTNVVISRSKQPLTDRDALRFEVGSWFDAYQGVTPPSRKVPQEPDIRTNNSSPISRQEFFKSFETLCSPKSGIVDSTPHEGSHRSKVFTVFSPRFNLLEVSKTVFY